MNTKQQGLDFFQKLLHHWKKLCVIVLLMQVALALEGLRGVMFVGSREGLELVVQQVQ